MVNNVFFMTMIFALSGCGIGNLQLGHSGNRFFSCHEEKEMRAREEKGSYGKFTISRNSSTKDVLQESIYVYINWLQNERIRLGGFFPVPSKLCGFILRAGGSVIGALSQRRPLASGICQRYNISEAEVLSQRRLLASGKPGSVIDKKEEACGPLSNQKPVTPKSDDRFGVNQNQYLL